MSGPAHFCPSCGYNFRKDEPVERDGWRLTPHSAEFNGRSLALANPMYGLLYAVAASKLPVSAEAIGNRISASDDPRNIAAVYMSRLRKQLGDSLPIETIYGSGYRWKRAA